MESREVLMIVGVLVLALIVAVVVFGLIYAGYGALPAPTVNV